MPAKKPVLLCVDDDIQCLEVRRLLLEAFGFNVVSSTNPTDGLRLYRRKRFDAAIIDFQMPEMDGAELAKKMKDSRGDVPVVIMSGLPELPEGTPVFHDRFFCKTISGKQLAEEIQALIAARTADSARETVGLRRGLLSATGVAVGIVAESISDRVRPMLGIKSVAHV